MLGKLQILDITGIWKQLEELLQKQLPKRKCIGQPRTTQYSDILFEFSETNTYKNTDTYAQTLLNIILLKVDYSKSSH